MNFFSFFNFRIALFFNLLTLSAIYANNCDSTDLRIENAINTDFHATSIKDLLIEADSEFNSFHFEKAIELYAELLQTNSEPSIHIIKNLADSYFNISNYSEAGIWYLKLYDIQQGNLRENYIIKLVECLKANRQLRKADEILINFYENKEALNSILTQKKHLYNQRRKSEKYTITNLTFNSAASDFGPALCKEGLVFISSRNKEKNNFELYRIGQDAAISADNYSGIIIDSAQGPALTFSRDSKTVYFTRNITTENRTNQQILRATVRNNSLTNIKVLSFNNKNYSYNHPAISADGKHLYFSSNMPGGYGESDIYKVTLNNNGDVISAPINLGSKINTAGREEYPFVQGQKLFFSSDAHYGMGGLDIFSAQINSNSEYAIPLNMGIPINSAMDDFSYIAERGRNKAYFSSNRVGGHGGSDIYQLVIKEELTFQEYSGYVLDENTKQPIANAHIQLSSILNKVNFTFKTDANGYYNLKLPSNNQHIMVFYKENYTNNQVGIETGEKPGLPSRNNIIYLSPLNKKDTTEYKSASIDIETNNF